MFVELIYFITLYNTIYRNQVQQYCKCNNLQSKIYILKNKLRDKQKFETYITYREMKAEAHAQSQLLIAFLKVRPHIPVGVLLNGGYVIAKLGISLGSLDSEQVVVRIQSLLNYISEGILEYKNAMQVLVNSFYQTPLDLQQQVKSRIFCFQFDQALNCLLTRSDYFDRKWQDAIKKRRLLIQHENIIAQMQKTQKQKRLQQEQNAGKIQCLICAQLITQQCLAVLSCSHIFHQQCVYKHLQHKIQSSQFPLLCPQGSCKEQISADDLYEYGGKYLVQKYDKLQFNRFVEGHTASVSWCPTAGCTSVFEFDAELDNYRCPICKTHYCLRCRCNYHTGMSCKEYKITMHYSEHDKMFQKFAEGSKFKQCPKCRFWVQRTAGCPTMSCRCGQQFCYTCGGVTCPHGTCSKK